MIASDQLAEWTSDPSVGLRERLLWQMLYDSAAKASEILNLDIEDLDVSNRSAVVIGKGGDAQRVYWTSATARLLPRYMAGRTTGPLFLASRRRPPAKAAAAGDTDPVSGLPPAVVPAGGAAVQEPHGPDASCAATLQADPPRRSRRERCAHPGHQSACLAAEPGAVCQPL